MGSCTARHLLVCGILWPRQAQRRDCVGVKRRGATRNKKPGLTSPRRRRRNGTSSSVDVVVLWRGGGGKQAARGAATTSYDTHTARTATRSSLDGTHYTHGAWPEAKRQDAAPRHHHLPAGGGQNEEEAGTPFPHCSSTTITTIVSIRQVSKSSPLYVCACPGRVNLSAKRVGKFHLRSARTWPGPVFRPPPPLVYVVVDLYVPAFFLFQHHLPLIVSARRPYFYGGQCRQRHRPSLLLHALLRLLFLSRHRPCLPLPLPPIFSSSLLYSSFMAFSTSFFFFFTS